MRSGAWQKSFTLVRFPTSLSVMIFYTENVFSKNKYSFIMFIFNWTYIFFLKYYWISTWKRNNVIKNLKYSYFNDNFLKLILLFNAECKVKWLEKLLEAIFINSSLNLTRIIFMYFHFIRREEGLLDRWRKYLKNVT